MLDIYGLQGFSVIAGGDTNTTHGRHATIAGGKKNIAKTMAFVGGGKSNYANGDNSAIAGGFENEANGTYSMIPGGFKNKINSNALTAFAAGNNAHADHQCSFVWSDCCPSPHTIFSSQGDNTFNARAIGGFHLYTACDLSTGAILTSGASDWNVFSSPEIKRNIRPVDGGEILRKLATLPLYKWSYKTQDPSIEHISPMAPDFHELFQVGENDKMISTIDPAGIALAAIKELYLIQQRLNEELEKVKDLEKKLDELEILKQELAEIKEQLK